MTHVRQQIIDDVATTLDGLTTTASRVYPSRVDQLSAAETPGLLIYDTDETVDEEQSTLQTQFRSAVIVVEGVIHGAGGDPVSDTLNLIASEVETAIFTDVTRSGAALGTFYASTSKSYDAQGDTVVGVIRLEFIIPYVVEVGAPDVAIT